jgi:hypothetical protein
MKQKHGRINVEAAIAVIDEWLLRDHLFYWDKPPEWIMIKLRSLVEEDGCVDYYTASRVLNEASTSKMLGPANRGFGYFREQWKKMRIR